MKSLNKKINKGTGVGGAKTNLNGLEFEKKTCIQNLLFNKGFKKIYINNSKYYFLELYDKINNIKIIYFTKKDFKMYFRENFNVITYKEPDEAFLLITDNQYHLKILEKKNQNVEGSVEEKLKTGDFTCHEYELMINDDKKFEESELIFLVSFAFCVSKFLQDKLESNKLKYNNIKKIMKIQNTKIFYGDSDDYFDKLYNWIIS